MMGLRQVAMQMRQKDATTLDGKRITIADKQNAYVSSGYCHLSPRNANARASVPTNEMLRASVIDGIDRLQFADRRQDGRSRCRALSMSGQQAASRSPSLSNFPTSYDSVTNSRPMRIIRHVICHHLCETCVRLV